MILRDIYVAGAAVLILAAPAAGAESAPGPAGALGAQLLNLVLGMGLVLALIAACAWLVKRFCPRTLAAGGILRVIAGTTVGQRERVVVVEIGETWLVLGVAPGSISALHQMPRAVSMDQPPTASAQQPFTTWLTRFVEKRNAR